jgi:hypothetical protein
MLASSKSNGSSDFGRIRSTFHAWKNSCDTVSSTPRTDSGFLNDVEAATTVLLRCSMPSPPPHGT